MDYIELIERAREQGASIAEISRATGVSFSTLYNAIRVPEAHRLSPQTAQKVLNGLKDFTPQKKASPNQDAVVTALKSVDLKDVARKTGLTIPHLQKLMNQPEYYNAKLENRKKIVDAVKEIQEEQLKRLSADRERLERELGKQNEHY